MRLFLFLLFAFVASAVPRSEAADRRYLLPITQALETPEAKEKLDGSVKFIFGRNDKPMPGSKVLRTELVPGKFHTYSRAMEEVCSAAFVRALTILNTRAKRVKGDAVVDIVSSFKGHPEFSSMTEFECYQGAAITSVTLRGDIVNLND
jgi:uncharacterized protein YbjQ (UPF0145 family)